MSTRMVWGSGPCPAPGFILGEAPGAEEDAEGIPFVGQSGKLLNEALEAAGLARDSVYVTNAFKLRPENNRTPNEDELWDHRGYLLEELSLCHPLAILALGNVAMGVVTGQFEGITKARGEWTIMRELGFGYPVMPTYHPSYVLRQGGRDTFAAHEFFKDVQAWADELGE